MGTFRKKFIKKNKTVLFNNIADSQLNVNQLNVDLQENLNTIKQGFGNTSDLVIRKFIIGKSAPKEAAAIYIEGLADGELVNEFITHSHSLMFELLQTGDTKEPYEHNIFDLAKEVALTIGHVDIVKNWNNVISSLLNGNTIVLINGNNDALSISTTGGDYRSISEPTTQAVVRGSKESFIESIRSNMVMIRRRIKNEKLRIEKIQIGDMSQTDVAFMYIEGTAKAQLITEIKQRLGKVDINAIIESGHIEEVIQDKIITPFPTVFNTERPDQLARNLLEGKVAIFIEGTPFALTVPTVFSEFFKTAEDYTQRYDISSLTRMLRYIAFHFSIFSSPIYIALITYHQEIIPTRFLISLMAQREGVPYPAMIEALLLEFTFEILREAGIRIPRAIGPTVSIAGALIIGDAAVSAGLVSPAMTIVVAMTAVSNFAIPSYSMSNTTRILRFIFMILAAFAGIYGIALGYFIMIGHLCSLQSFGVSYLSPFAPFYLVKQKDTILRFPFSLLDHDNKENR